MKIKIFTAETAFELDRNINAWLDENSDIIIHKMEQSSATNGTRNLSIWTTISILYSRKKKVGEYGYGNN